MEGANKLIPSLSTTVKDIFFLKDKVKALTKDLENLAEIWGREIFDKSNSDHKLYSERLISRNSLFRSIQAKIDAIRSYGCLVKNIDQGLIDFLYDCGGEYVYLCWKYGESDIKFWHPLKEGFVGRRPISELFGIQSR